VTKFKVQKAQDSAPVKRGRKPIYPFGQMDIGDEFICPSDHRGTKRNKQNTPYVSRAAYSYGHNHDKIFSSATQPDKSVRIVRLG
jgi:hypothetical protein